jgi:hypothetical protein
MTSHEALTTLDDRGAVPPAVRLFAIAQQRVGRPRALRRSAVSPNFAWLTAKKRPSNLSP